MTISDADKLAEAEREIGMRRKVYPGLVKGDRLLMEEAQRRIEIMEAIARDYRERVQPSLALRPLDEIEP